MARVESSLQFEPQNAVSADLNVSDADLYLGGRKGNLRKKLRMGTIFPVRVLMQWTSIIGVLVWVSAAGYFICRIIR